MSWASHGLGRQCTATDMGCVGHLLDWAMDFAGRRQEGTWAGPSTTLGRPLAGPVVGCAGHKLG
jgi:hypothetical protein